MSEPLAPVEPRQSSVLDSGLLIVALVALTTWLWRRLRRSSDESELITTIDRSTEPDEENSPA